MARRFRKRKVQMGLIGKTGIIVAGGIPIALAAFDAIDPWTGTAWATADLRAKLVGSAYGFANNLTQGFGLGPAFPSTVGTFLVNNSAPAAAYVKTTGAGISLVVIDGVIGVITRFAAGGRARPKIMGRQLISG